MSITSKKAEAVRKVYFGARSKKQKRIASNKVRTSKYTWFSWAPLSLLF